jgi:signal transduction histidine kinase
VKSLRTKVFLGVLAGLLLVVLAAEAVIYRQAVAFAEMELVNSLKRYAVALTGVVYINQDNRLTIHHDWESRVKIGEDDRAEFFEFKSHDGAFITDSHNLGGESLPETGTNGGYKLVDYGTVLLGVYEHHFRLPRQNQVDQSFKLLVANNTGLVASARALTIRSLILFTPLALIAAFAVSFGLTTITLSSISKFRTRVATLESSGEKKRLDLDGVDIEMKPLGQALNKFVDQTNQQLVNESRLLADTAHELHIPLLKMRTELERLQQGEPTVQAFQHGLQEVAKGITGLQRMTDNMLLLYRIESGKYRPRLSSMDLRDELKRILKNLEHELSVEGLRIQLQGDPVQVCCNRSVIMLIITQLIRNASMYAPGSPINISWQRSDNNVLLHIDDNGIGIDPAERELVFERLYRITDHVHQQPSGSGLGLSLVRLYAESMHASTQCHESSTGGARFTITLPVKCQKP